MRSRGSFAAGLIVLVCFSLPKGAAQEPKFDSDTISGLGARNIGSATTGGRVSAVAAVRENGRLTVYVGAASGGVWKSVNGGTTYKPVFHKEPVQSIGAIAIDLSNPKTIWVGTGESWMRNSVSIGDGIYKSTDAGENWTNMGLKDSEHIAKILIDPKDSNTVYACVPGKAWSDSDDRGLYKTSDGGKSWSKILKGSNLSTGCSMISMDPRDPKTIYAGLWDFRRKGWTFRSGGDSPTSPSGSAFFKTSDGGATWTELDDKNTKGLPPKPWGRIAVTVAPSKPDVVYALIESTRSALFRSDDGGKTWQERDRSQSMVWRPFYFANLIVDPKDENKIYKPDFGLVVSTDGGKSFSNISGGAHGDFHDVWIDPGDSNRVIAGDDGGIWYSDDGGNKWWKGGNLPIGQWYHVSVDEADPYHVFGGLQDNSVWMGDSAYPGGITNSRWENMYGGDGFFAFADPTDPAYLYVEAQGGDIGRVNRFTHESRAIKPQPKYGEGKLRFNWNTPIHMSPNEKGTIYIGAQFLFRSRDHGQTWDRISPDLTTNDPEKQKQEQSGGVTVDNSVAEEHTTIFSISESPRNGQVIWAGTDDGNLQLTRDGGKNWTNVVANVPGLPKFSWVSWVEASRFDEGTAYAAFDRHWFGDMDPYFFKTTDFGKTWTALRTKDCGVRGWAHVIKEDTLSPNLLFAGTEFGLWISIDGGKEWAQYKGNDFPAVAVRDLVVQPRDSALVIATHGRGIWVVDDISPLREMTPDLMAKDAAFIKARPQQQRLTAFGGWAEGDAMYVGPNPPDAALITYYQKKRHIFGRMKIEIVDRQGKLVDTLPANSRRGLTRLEWSMRLKPPRVPTAATIAGEATEGLRVLPGKYTVKMTRGKEAYTTPLDLTLDRRAKFTVEDRKMQYEAVLRLYKLFRDMSFDVDQINGVHQALLMRASQAKTDDALETKLRDATAKDEAIRKKIVATQEGGAITGEERIREKTSQVYGALNSYEGRPADYYIGRIDSLSRELGDVMREFETFTAKDLQDTNAALEKKSLKPVTPMTRAQWDGANSESGMSANARGRLVSKLAIFGR
ncbi:MAG: glycosyl hydrolase [Acidobacteriaceae bacterium]|nr:glycosyl hydrolase [Acidobacteriaceae bacterium]